MRSEVDLVPLPSSSMQKAIMNHLILLIFFAQPALLFAQGPDHATDPEAQKILSRLADDIRAKEDMTYQFRLSIEYPESEAEIIEGFYYQKGSLYRLETPTHHFISDQKSKWVVDLAGKEIQIHDFFESSGEDISDPQSLLNIYQNPHFTYRLAFEGKSGPNEVQIFEFKPVKSGGDLSKAILTLNKTTGQIQKMEVFNRDGSRLYLDIISVKSNTGIPDERFSIMGAQFEDFTTEDLRIE